MLSLQCGCVSFLLFLELSWTFLDHNHGHVLGDLFQGKTQAFGQILGWDGYVQRNYR